MVINNKLIIQWLKAVATSPNNVTISYPISFNVVLTCVPGLIAPYSGHNYGWDIVNTTNARAVYYRTDHSASYTMGWICRRSA